LRLDADAAVVGALAGALGAAAGATLVARGAAARERVGAGESDVDAVVVVAPGDAWGVGISDTPEAAGEGALTPTGGAAVISAALGAAEFPT